MKKVGRDSPEALGGNGVERPFLHAVWVLRKLGVVSHGVGLSRVVEIVTSGMSELRGNGRDDRGGGSLFDGFVGKDAGGFAASRDSLCCVEKFRCSPVATPPKLTAATMPSEAHRRVASTAKSEFAVLDWA